MNKVHLILVDGMRPDALQSCGDPMADWLIENSRSALSARTVMPSVTLPCHMSLFHSVDPCRHGVTTNTYMPQVRPIDGICERLKDSKRCGFSFNWEELRDLSRPGSLSKTYFAAGHTYGYEAANQMVTNASLTMLKEDSVDFLFTYLGWVDDAGHANGWMSDEYMRALRSSLQNIRQLLDATPEDCLTIITADHGGHGRTHGTELDEDMTIPVLLHGTGLHGTIDTPVSILDLAPTIVGALGCTPAPEWEGKNLL